MIDERTVLQWWDIFKSNCPLTEVRLLGQGGRTFSGYFTDPDTMLAQLRQYNGVGFFATINEIKDTCYGRSQHDIIVQKPKATTSDNDIERRRWILIDLDPDRSSDTNSTEEQKALALQRMKAVYRYLRDEGFNAPVVADSSNGYHLYYSVDLGNTPENTELVSDFLKALDMLFSDDTVKIDTSVFNASRISKIIGTKSNKGTDTPGQPQRFSKFVHVPDKIVTTGIEYIRKVASLLPKQEAPSRFNGYSRERFDIEGFIRDHGIEIAKRSRFSGGEKLVLKECPFDPNHKAPDAAIFVMDSGAIGFRCLHNSCRDYTWRDVRLKFDPQAYDRKDYEEYRQRRAYYGKVEPRPIEPVKEDGRGKKWLSMTDIKWFDPSQLISIPTGILEIDKKMMGLTLGDVTVLSGLSGSGKTTLLDSLILNAVQRGYKAAAWSGELQDFRFQAWLDQMAAGKGFVREKPGYDGLYYAPRNVSEKINEWLNGKFWLYNNEYGDEWSHLMPDVEECVKKNGVQLIVLDNLMALTLDEADGSENERQTKLIKDIKSFAKKANIHIVLVCHPRKEQSFQLLRKESIAGTANLTNLADNVIISHRVGRDFERRAKDFFGEQTTQAMLDYDVVIEVAKNRSLGVVDHLVGLYYEPETRRIKNNPAENIVYGWSDTPVQTSFDTELEDMPDFSSGAYSEEF